MTIREVEMHPVFRRALWRRNLYLALLLVLELTLLIVLACLRISTHAGKYHLLQFDLSFEPWRWGTLIRLVLSVAVLVGFSHYGFVTAFKGKGMIHLWPTDRSKGRLFGSLRGPEVVALVQEAARALGVSRIDRIAVARQPDPNAYTARILGLGNVVVVNSNLLNILPREGVRTVIAHEVAHIRRKDSVLYQLLSVPRGVAWVIVLLNFARVVGGVLEAETFLVFCARLSFLTGAGWLLSRAFGFLERLANLASQQTELMVDAYAAQVGGWDSHLNALLLIGERAEALTGYLKAIQAVAGRLDDELNETSLLRLMNRLPAEEHDEKRAVENAAGLYIVDRLTVLREKLRVPLTDEQISDLAARAAEDLRRHPVEDEPLDDEEENEEMEPAAREEARNQGREEARRKEKEERQQEEKELKQKLLFWRDYDKDRSGFLSAAELDRLVADLRKQPERMIFREFLEPDAQWKDHPTTRHRILFLADVFAVGKT
jgi:Zn-dependent protease with chaperone function